MYIRIYLWQGKNAVNEARLQALNHMGSYERVFLEICQILVLSRHLKELKLCNVLTQGDSGKLGSSDASMSLRNLAEA